MRKAFIVLIVLVGISCQSVKNKYKPITDYLDSSVGKKKVIIIDEKISNARTFKIFNGSFLFDTKTNSLERLGNQSKLYNPNDYKKMIKENSLDTVNSLWVRKNFKRENVIVTNKNKFTNNELYKEYSGGDEMPVYMFSNPIPYQNDSICLFTVLKSNTTFSPPLSEFIIIMKRNKGKWIVVDKVWADESHIN